MKDTRPQEQIVWYGCWKCISCVCVCEEVRSKNRNQPRDLNRESSNARHPRNARAVSSHIASIHFLSCTSRQPHSFVSASPSYIDIRQQHDLDVHRNGSVHHPQRYPHPQTALPTAVRKNNILLPHPLPPQLSITPANISALSATTSRHTSFIAQRGHARPQIGA